MSGRVAAVVVVLIWIGLAVGVTAGYGAALAAVLCPIVIVALFGAWRLAFVPYVSVSASGVIVQNPIGRSTVPYSAIAEVGTGYTGLVLRLKNGRAVLCWAVQKSNAAKWSQSRSRADEVADAIRARVAEG
jgi:hypothetical protein